MGSVFAAIVFLAVLVGNASANRLSISSQTRRDVWTSMEFEAGITARCPVTLEGSVHSTVSSKTAGALSGYVTRAIVGEASCIGGRARALTENLPWHIRYTSFVGTLPDITAISETIIGARFLIAASFPIIGTVSCLYVSEVSHPATGTLNLGTGGVINSVTAGGRINGSGICPEGSLRGSGTVTVLGSTTAITVRLI
jgi:hypothetical protein